MAETRINSGKAIALRSQARFAIRNTARCLLVLGAVLALPCVALPIRQALGMIESGNDDHAVGSAGEISRYQIKKDIWRTYSFSAEFWDEKEAWRIADKVLTARAEEFRRCTGRAPAAFDIYVLWNAPGQFRSVGYQPQLISRVVAERAMRFANLVGVPEPRALVGGNGKTEKDSGSAVRPEGARQLASAMTGRN